MEGSDGATTQIVTEDAGPVPAKIEKKKEEEDNKLREEFESLVDRVIGKLDSRNNQDPQVFGDLGDVLDKANKVTEGSDDTKIQDVIEEMRSVLEKFERLEKLEGEIKIKNRRKMLMDWGEGIRDSIDGGEAEKREKIERAIEELEKVQGFDAAADQVKRIIIELGKMQGFDGDTIRVKVREVKPMLELWATEEGRKQEAEQSVRSDLRQIKLALIREKPDSFANFQESLSEVEAVMKSGDVDGARKQLNLLQETDEYQALLSRHKERSAQIEQDFFKHERKLSEPLHEEVREMRDRLLESRGRLPMSKEDFDLYFSPKDFEVSADLKQQNVGDCYLIAAIHAMSCSPHFELLCRSSMERSSDGSWRVKIPLLNEDGEWITVTKEEILPQKNKKFLGWGWFRPDDGLDTRAELRPVQGKEGLQVLEAAHIKKEGWSSVVDRLAAEGGFGGKALSLFVGDNFVKFEVNPGLWNQGRPLKTLDSEEADLLDSFLESFDPEVYMATAGTGIYDDSLPGAPGTEELLVANHFYSITGVNAEERTITLANPWNTLRPMEMSFDHFKENFSNVGAVRVDNANLLLNMRKIDRKRGNI